VSKLVGIKPKLHYFDLLQICMHAFVHFAVAVQQVVQQVRQTVWKSEEGVRIEYTGRGTYGPTFIYG